MNIAEGFKFFMRPKSLKMAYLLMDRKICLVGVDQVVLLGHPVEVAGEPSEDPWIVRDRLYHV
jgi:hypothetical protein